MHFSDVEVGKQLIVGTGTYYDCLGLGMNVIRGSAYIEGPFLLGDARSFSEKVLATAMIARDVNKESNNPPRSLHVKGNTRLEGDDGTPNALNITGNTKQVGDVQRTGDENATGTITASGNITTNAKFIGDIILRAPKGKIRIEAQDIELVANGYNGRTGYIALDSNEKIILKSKSIDIRATETARFFSENKLDVIGNAIMNIYGGLVDMADGATSILGSKTGPSSTEENAKSLKDKFEDIVENVQERIEDFVEGVT